MPYVKSQGAKIYYEFYGEGQPIIFVHGAGGNTLVWHNQIPYFAPTYKVLTFDHRGWGRSLCTPNESHARYFSEDLKAVLDDAGIERTSLVCQSMGGWTGMHFALSNPERVSCLVLSATPGGIKTTKVMDDLRDLDLNRRTQNQDSSNWKKPQIALAPDAFERNPKNAFLYRLMTELNEQRQSPSGITDMMICPSKLSKFSIPTLMISGGKDRIFSTETLEQVCTEIPGAQIVSIEDSGHSPYFESPERFNQYVESFVVANAL